MPTEKQTAERFRILARKQGLDVVKSRCRKYFHYHDQGLYQIIDTRKKGRVIRGERFELTLEDVAEFFRKSPQER